MPANVVLKILLLIGVVIISFVLVNTFLRYTSPYGWLKESVKEDYTQTTSDGKYEYRLEIINIFQRNSYARLYVRDVSNDEIIKIRLDIPTWKKHAISGGLGYVNSGPEAPWVWSTLLPLDNKSIYILTTTNVFDKDHVYCFQVNIEEKTAKRIQVDS